MERIALALAVLAVSWASIFIRLCSAPPLVMAFYRMALSAIVLAPFAGLHRKPAWLRDRASVMVALGAGLLLGLHFAAWIASLQLTSVASSVVLVTTTPVFTALFSSRLLGERAGGRAWAGIALGVLGSALIAWGDLGGQAPALEPSGANAAAGAGAEAGASAVGGASTAGILDGTGRALVGDLLAFAGALFAAGYFTLGRKVRGEAPLVGYLVVVYATGAIAVGVGALARGEPFTGYPARDWVLFAAMAIVPNLVGHSLLNRAVRNMRAYVVNVAALGEPILATIYAIVLFGEVPGPAWGAGTVLILSGVLTVFFAERTGAVVELPPD